MKPTDILSTVTNIKKDLDDYLDSGIKLQDAKIKLTEKYSEFSMSYPVIFIKTLDNQLDIDQFREMVHLADQVNNKKISQHGASVQVGASLVNKYVKPILNKKKKK